MVFPKSGLCRYGDVFRVWGTSASFLSVGSGALVRTKQMAFRLEYPKKKLLILGGWSYFGDVRYIVTKTPPPEGGSCCCTTCFSLEIDSAFATAFFLGVAFLGVAFFGVAFFLGAAFLLGEVFLRACCIGSEQGNPSPRRRHGSYSHLAGRQR